MDDMTNSAGTFRKDWLAYAIQQDSNGWRWTCTLLDMQFATGTEPTEARALTMAQAARSARFALEIAELRAMPPDEYSFG
jgi:hypothetical protein